MADERRGRGGWVGARREPPVQVEASASGSPQVGEGGKAAGAVWHW